MSNENPDQNDDFWERVGEDNDPVRFFTKKVKECGAQVFELDDGYIEIIGGCDNLIYHEADDFREIFCGKCGICVSVNDVKDLSGNSLSETAGEDETATPVTPSTEPTATDNDGLDEFMNKVTGSE